MAERFRLRLDNSDIRHLAIVVVASVILLSSLITPWWTRGYTIDYADDQPDTDTAPVFVDTFTVSYYPFQTPAFGPFQFDSVREAAVTITGIAIALSALLALGHNLVRWGIRTGRVDTDLGVPVKLAIASFLVGAFGVLFALLWPFMGINSDGIFSADAVFGGDAPDGVLVEDQSFLNAGFFLGILGFMMYPAYLWVDAHLNRAARVGVQSVTPEGQPVA